MFRFLYQLATYGLALSLLPKFFYRQYKGTLCSQSLHQRLGLDFPSLPERDGLKVWVHAVSLGETKAVAPLVRLLRQVYPEAVIVFSNITETGHEEAKRSIPEADAHVFLPFDFRGTMERLLQRFTPELVLVTETDIWYNFLSLCRERGARVILVNGKVSQRTCSRLQRIPWVAKHLFGCFDHFCLQAELYQQRFASLGLAESKMTVTGNLKFDQLRPSLKEEERQAFRRHLGIREGDRVVVLGSTHDPEERELLSRLIPLQRQFPHLKCLLVPRHPERFDQVAQLLQNFNQSYSRYSEGPCDGEKPWVLVDAMGQLMSCYECAHVAVVCGSFTSKVGGHNILESCDCGVPTLYGPEMHSQPDLHELARGSQGAVQVTLEGLVPLLEQLLLDPVAHRRFAERALALAQAQKGATERTWKNIADKLDVKSGTLVHSTPSSARSGAGVSSLGS